VIEHVAGTLLSSEDADYVAKALDLLRGILTDQGSRPTPRLDAVAEKLRRTVAKTGVSGPKTGADARFVASQGNSADHQGYAFVDTDQAARILGCSTNNVRDLARRGALPARQAGGRWIFDAEAVMRRAERRTHT
jgi:excisionase family DNA binding protein